jgi:hypothetical protein
LREVAITLPLADKAFLSVPTLEIRHSPLPWLLLGGKFAVHDISMSKPELDVLQDPSGSWNLAEVAQLLARIGGAKNESADSKAQSNTDIPQLPRLDVNDATLVITDNERRSATISNLSITGRSDGPVVWDYRAIVPDQLDITGKVAPGDVWNHEITLDMHDVGSWMSPWISSWPRSAHLGAVWSGQIADGGVAGRLDVNDAVYGANKIAGPIEISFQGDHATLQPAGLMISNSNAPSLSAQISSGQIQTNAADIESRQLSIAFAGGRASVDGKYLLADGSANLHAAWRDIVLPQSVTQSGDLSVNFTPTLGEPRFSAVLTSQGASKSVTWDSRLNLNGSGNSLRSLSLSLAAPRLRIASAVNQKSAVDLSGLAAELIRNQTGLTLSNLRLGNANPLAGHGGYTFATQTAWLSLDARGWPIPHAGPSGLNLDFDIWCDPSRVHLEQLYVNSGMFTAYGNGEYVYDLPKPVSAHLYFAQSSALATSEQEAQPFQGNLRGNLDLEGTLNPANLTLSGKASGTDVHIGTRPLGDLALALEGNVRDGEVSLSSRNIQFLGGDWNISGQWPVKNTLVRLDTIRVRHLSLPLALARKDVTGQLDGSWSVDIRQFNPNGIFVQGTAAISDLTIGGAASNSAGPIFAADKIQISRINLEDGQLDIKSIKLARKMSGIDGSATASLSTTLAHPTQLSIRLDGVSWPLYPGDANRLCVLWAKGKFDVDVKERSALGHLDLRADTSWNSHPVGRVDATVDFNRRLINASKIQVQALGGSGSGEADIDLDHPYQSRGKLDWKDLDLSLLQGDAVNLSGLTGKVRGSLEIHPAIGPRPLQPLAIALHIFPENVRWSHVRLGDMQAFAFAGPERFVLDGDPSRPSQVAFAGGLVEFWGRLSRHPGDLYQTLIQINLQNLDLDSILPAGSKAARTPGLLGGQITILGRPDDPELASGEGHITLSKSDLAGTGPIAILYNLMHFGHNANKPQGYGTIDFHIAQKSVSITSLRYFDRGAEVHAAGIIREVSKLSHSPIDITLVGSLRPLKSIDLPGVSDIDEALNAVQRNAVTIRVTGDFNKPVTKRVLFSDINQDVQNLLIGVVHGNRAE